MPRAKPLKATWAADGFFQVAFWVGTGFWQVNQRVETFCEQINTHVFTSAAATRSIHFPFSSPKNTHMLLCTHIEGYVAIQIPAGRLGKEYRPSRFRHHSRILCLVEISNQSLSCVCSEERWTAFVCACWHNYHSQATIIHCELKQPHFTPH